MNPVLLAAIVDLAAKNVSPQFPHGYTYIEASKQADLQALHNGGMIVVQAQSAHGFPVVPTQAGVDTVKQHASAPHSQPAHAPQVQHAPQFDPSTIVVEDNVAVPEPRRFGPQSTGTSQVDLYPFNTLNIGQSFFLPQDAGSDKPKHRTFSSVVSQANKKFYPKDFIVREDNKNGQPGARVFRQADLTAPRPTRAPRQKAAEAPQAPQAFAGPQHGTPQPFAPQQFAPQPGQGFPQPGQGFPAPQAPSFAPPAGPQGFPAPQQPAPQGFDTAPPNGWQAPGFEPPAGAFGGFPPMPE